MSQTVKNVGRKTSHARSAVANRTRLFIEPLDERSLYGRRYKGLVYDIAADAGGIETLSELRLALVRRSAAIIIEIEKLEGRLARGDDTVDVDLLGRLTGHLRRLSETLGLDRITRDITPNLADIIAQNPAPPRRQEKPASAPKAIEAAILPAQPIEPGSALPEPPAAPADAPPNELADAPADIAHERPAAAPMEIEQ
jgi:hypothetical protein